MPSISQEYLRRLYFPVTWLLNWNKQIHWACHGVLQSCTTFCDPMDYNPPCFSCPWNFSDQNTGGSCHFPLQAIFKPRNQACVSCISSICRQILYHYCYPKPKPKPFDTAFKSGPDSNPKASQTLNPNSTCAAPSTGCLHFSALVCTQLRGQRSLHYPSFIFPPKCLCASI